MPAVGASVFPGAGMHGILFHELRGYAQFRLGAQGWESLLTQAGLPPRIYLAFQQYPDAEVKSLVEAAARLTGQPLRETLEDFGEYTAPSLLKKYRVLVEPHWTVLDVLEHSERILAGVRRGEAGQVPRLDIQRRQDVVEVSYSSPRKLCGMGIGFVRGLAKQLGQRVVVHERQCMLQSAPRCEVQVRLLS